MKLPKALLIHEIEIEDYEGEGAYGPTYGESYTVGCYVEYERKVVRDQNGNEVVSEAQVVAPPGVNPPPDSQVTFDGREHSVITVSPKDNPLNGRRFSVEVALK